jgi:hypothetical protein
MTQMSGKVALAGSAQQEEIWKQERSRMAKLLKPRTTF